MSTIRIIALASVAVAAPAFAGIPHVVPTAFENTAGNGVFIGPLSNGARTYQLLIHADQLSGLVGQSLTGFSWRTPPSATSAWPAADTTYGNYDVYLSGSVDPEDRSLTFSENVVGAQSQVRAGSLSIPAGSYASGGSPNAFGPSIDFGAGWLYTGGNLLVEIRHTGSDGLSRSVDAITASSGPASGYGTQFSAAWTADYAGLTGAQGNFGIIRFEAIPTPGAGMLALGAGLAAARRRR